jgi:hypothetical protein
MVTATGALVSAATPAVQGTGVTGGLDAQLARYEKQLAECVNCASARTPEGKQAIEDLYGKIHDTKAKIEEVRIVNPVQPASAAESAAQVNTAVSATPDVSNAQDRPFRRASIYDTVGSVIDVYG